MVGSTQGKAQIFLEVFKTFNFTEKSLIYSEKKFFS